MLLGAVAPEGLPCGGARVTSLGFLLTHGSEGAFEEANETQELTLGHSSSEDSELTCPGSATPLLKARTRSLSGLCWQQCCTGHGPWCPLKTCKDFPPKSITLSRTVRLRC